jgi:hypothetical protein
MTFDKIAAFCLGPLDIPDTALDAAATLLIDTLGVAAGAAPMESGRIARDHAVRFIRGGNDKGRRAAPLRRAHGVAARCGFRAGQPDRQSRRP